MVLKVVFRAGDPKLSFVNYVVVHCAFATFSTALCPFIIWHPVSSAPAYLIVAQITGVKSKKKDKKMLAGSTSGLHADAE